MRRVLAAAVAMVAVACGPEAPVDTGLDDMGLMAWRGNVYATLHLDAMGAPPDVAERVRADILRRTVPGRIEVTGWATPYNVSVRVGYCQLAVDTRTETVTSEAHDCALADSSSVPRDGATPLTFGPVQGVLSAAAATRTASEIRISTTWNARAGATGERPQPWEGPVSITYVLTR